MSQQRRYAYNYVYTMNVLKDNPPLTWVTISCLFEACGDNKHWLLPASPTRVPQGSVHHHGPVLVSLWHYTNSGVRILVSCTRPTCLIVQTMALVGFVHAMYFVWYLVLQQCCKCIHTYMPAYAHFQESGGRQEASFQGGF